MAYPCNRLMILATALFCSLPLRAVAATNTVETAMVQLRVTPSMIANPDPTPFLRIYKSGRAVVHYPRYMKQSGDYELMLTEAELKALLDSLYDNGIMTIDIDALKSARSRQVASEPDVASGPYAHNFATTVLELNVDSYDPPGATKARLQNVSRKITWRDLERDARRHPDIPGIKQLQTAVAALLEIRKRPDLKPRSVPKAEANE